MIFQNMVLGGGASKQQVQRQIFFKKLPCKEKSLVCIFKFSWYVVTYFFLVRKTLTGTKADKSWSVIHQKDTTGRPNREMQARWMPAVNKAKESIRCISSLLITGHPTIVVDY